MRDNALYFPYINIPKSEWIIHTLLYWDKIYSIVPYEYIYNPDLLSSEMRNLVSAELAEQIIPGQYIHEIPNFETSFSGYIEEWIKKRDGDLGYEFSTIHAEKIGSLDQLFGRHGIVKEIRYPWFTIPTPIANMFMAYLASCLGKLPSINSTPLMDINVECNGTINNRHELSKRIILSELMPVPKDITRIKLDDIASFKDRYSTQTRKFRDKIENECAKLALIKDNDLQYQQTQDVLYRLKQETKEIEDAMKSRWKNLSFKTLLPLIATCATGVAIDFTNSLEIVGGVATLATVVQQAFETESIYKNFLDKPLAYAAIANTQIL